MYIFEKLFWRQTECFKISYLCEDDFCLSKISPALYLHSVLVFWLTKHVLFTRISPGCRMGGGSEPFYFSERYWINEYIHMPGNTGCAYKQIDKTHAYNCILFFWKSVLTYVTLVINFWAAILVESVTLLRWLCLLKMAVLCWKFNWGLLHYAFS